VIGVPNSETPFDSRRKGVRLGVDVGTVRVGVALSDPHGVLATPVTTLARNPAGETDLIALAALVEEHEVVEVVVGLPRTLRGADGPAVIAARAYGDLLAARIAPVPVVYVDERLTTVSADRLLSEAGVRGKARRKVVDQVAATRILQNRLDNLAGGAR
jgi:putative Holliday junction resolvase